MSIEYTLAEELEYYRRHHPVALIQGAKAMIKYTGQVVKLIRVSSHGISVVAFTSGGEYFISNKYLEPLATIH